MIKALLTLMGAAVAGVLVWTAAQLDRNSTGGYWAVLGILAGAGLVLALARLSAAGGPGRPSASWPTFVLVFLPVLLTAGWALIAGQPHANWFRSHVRTWSGDIGLGSVVDDVAALATVLALGVGLVFGFCFDRVVSPRPGPPEEPRAVEPAAPPEAERGDSERDLVYSGSRED
jgi:hypothetical protein